jgi:hypothetical protein
MILLFTRMILLVALGTGEVPDDMPMDDYEMENDFSPMLALFALIGLAIVLILIGVGIVLAIAATILIGLLILMGIVSSSALVALYTQNFASGFRAMHYQICSTIATGAGLAIGWLGSRLINLGVETPYVVGVGGIAGLAAGLIFAFALDQFSGFAYRRIKDQVEARKAERAAYAAIETDGVVSPANADE